MRVDPNYILKLSSAISQSSLAESNLTNELSSGLRVSQVGDDPVASAQALKLTTEVSRSDTFVQTASRQSGVLQVTDATLGEVVTQLTSAVSLATQASNGTLNADNRSAILNQIQGIQAQVLSLANTSYLGQHLFSGSKGSTTAFTLNTTTGVTTYGGDAVQETVQTPAGQALPINLPGSSVFQNSGGDVFAALADLISNLQNGTPTTGDVANITNALGQVSTQRSILDSSLSRLQATSTYVSTQEVNLKAQQNTLIASNPVDVATSLKSAETQHEALLSIVAALGKGSLFDYLK